MPAVLAPFLVGVLVTPIAKHVAKPLLRGAIKTSIKIVVDAKRAAHRANEGIHDLAAEATAEMFAAEAADISQAADTCEDNASPAKRRSATGKTR